MVQVVRLSDLYRTSSFVVARSVSFTVDRNDAEGVLQNLFPVQIENVLMGHPAILEAAVVAVPDPRYVEVVGAWIVRDPHHPGLSREGVRRTVAEGMNPQVRRLY